MFKMVIESNHEKLQNEGLYNIEQFDKTIRDICLETNFTETSPNHYTLSDKYDEIGRMMVLNARFKVAKCVIPNLKTWLTYSDEEGEVNWLT